MHYLIGILGITIASTAFATDAPAPSIGHSPQIQVHLSVANPCLNSRYADHPSCTGKSTYRAIENMQQLPLRSVSGEVVSGSGTNAYRVRTIDFY